MTLVVTGSIDRLLTVQDIMALLRISRPTLYRLLKSGRLVPVRIGKRTLFDPEDIRSFVEASKKASPDRPGASREQQKKTKPDRKRAKDKPKKGKEGPSRQHHLPAKSQEAKQPKSKAPDDTDRQGRLL